MTDSTGLRPASGATRNEGEMFASGASQMTPVGAGLQLRHERDLLAGALGRVLVASGVANDVPLTGPQLLLLADDLAEHLTARPRWNRPDDPTDTAAPGNLYDELAEFTEALAERGLPRTASLADLIRHERGQMGMIVALECMGEMHRAANRLEEAGDKHGADAIRKAVKEGAPSDDPT